MHAERKRDWLFDFTLDAWVRDTASGTVTVTLTDDGYEADLCSGQPDCTRHETIGTYNTLLAAIRAAEGTDA